MRLFIVNKHYTDKCEEIGVYKTEDKRLTLMKVGRSYHVSLITYVLRVGRWSRILKTTNKDYADNAFFAAAMKIAHEEALVRHRMEKIVRRHEDGT